ncbi:MAG: hypothetical protein IT556_16875 [Acetobacteraceae bacterium]|nr:hypothetical protein [Acetobacteraceae bacterium]
MVVEPDKGEQNPAYRPPGACLARLPRRGLCAGQARTATGRKPPSGNSTFDRWYRLARLCLPRLAKLDAKRGELTQVADAPALPEDAGTTLREAGEKRRAAEATMRRAGEAISRLRVELDALVREDSVLAEQDAIDALAELRVTAMNAIRDLPKVREAVAAYRARIEAAGAAIDPAWTPESLCESLPAEHLRRKVQQQISQRTQLVARADSAQEALNRAERDREAAAKDLESAPKTCAPGPLRRALEDARALRQIDAQIDRADRAWRDAQRKTAAALAALSPSLGDAAALAACRVPAPGTTETTGQALLAARERRGKAQDAVKGIDAAIAGLEAEIAATTEGSAIPTREAIAAARAERDRVWRLVRRQLEGGPAPDAAERSRHGDRPLPEAFEIVRDQADQLADRRADEANRVAEFLERTAQLNGQRGRLAEATHLLADATGAAEAAEQAWGALWAPAAIANPLDPPAMAEWQRQRSAVLALAEAEDNALGKHAELIGRRDQCRASLAPLLQKPPPEVALSPLIEYAETVLERRQEAAAAHSERARKLDMQDASLTQARREADEAAGKIAGSDTAWMAAIAPLGFSETAPLDAVEARLAAWSTVAEAATAWRGDTERAAGMEAVVNDFSRRTEALVARLGEPALTEPADQRVAQLARRLYAARTAAAKAESLQEQIRTAEDAQREGRQAFDNADTTLSALRSMAGAADDEALAQAIERTKQRVALLHQIGELETELRDQGDGKDEAALRAEAAGLDPDAAIARLKEIETDQNDLGDQREKLVAARTEVAATLDKMKDGRNAAELAQQAENALADARSAAERFARVHMARTLLRAAAERFRRNTQAPLLHAAGAHFSVLTGGRYTRLDIDEDDGGKAFLLARRGDSRDCRIKTLSDGTRDQLFLALRVAAIELHAAMAEPLPLIIDDVLVQFDDERAARALALLNQLGRTTQVILFTHHRHIADLARHQPGAHVQELAEPVAAAAAVAARLA